MVNQTSKNGYKVCKIFKKNQTVLKIFLCKSFVQAVKIKESFTNQEKNKNTYWNIYPISNNDIKTGIWKECPFNNLSKYIKGEKQNETKSYSNN